MKTTIKLLTLTCILSCANLGAAQTKKPTEVPAALPELTKQSFDVEGHPESVVVDSNGDIYYTSIGEELNPTAKDGDGAIYVRPFGTHLSRKVAGELNAPKGMLLIDGYLYFTDVNMMMKMDPKNGQIMGYIDFSPYRVNFLNDLVKINYGRMVVSATDTNQLFILDPVTNTYAELVTKEPLNAPNGLAWDPNTKTLYVCEYSTDDKGKPNGRILTVNILTGEVSEVSSAKGQFDGIAIHNGNLYVSDWAKSGKPGAIQRCTLKAANRSYDTAAQAVDGPADFTIFNNMIVIPGMKEKKIHIQPIPKK